MDMNLTHVEACINHPGENCDVWEGTASDYTYTQKIYMVTGTNILDTYFIHDDDTDYRADYVGMNTTRPDASHFIPPKGIPCNDFTSVPASNDKKSWTSKKYPGKEFHVTPLSAIFNRPESSSPADMVHYQPTESHLAIPDSFDARKYWPQCSTIKTIRDQGSCGSCWAFGAAESFSDRYCIATGDSVTFSPQFLVDCFNDSDGCNGGYTDLTWMALMKQGITSDDCLPYLGKDDDCRDTCSDHTPMKLRYAKSAYSPYVAFDVNATVRAIQEEIMANGPVETAFYVFTDFMSYSNGVYHRTTTSVDGGHAVKIIGWGVDEASKEPYWLIANSWGEDWGEDGFFRIRRGTDECNIESEIATGLIKN